MTASLAPESLSLESFVPASELERQKRLRREMKLQDERRYTDPDAIHGLPTLSVLFVWRKSKWWVLAFVRGAVTPARLKRWHKRYKVAADEIVHVVDLLTGTAPTKPPMLPPRSKRPSRLHKQSADVVQIRTGQYRVRSTKDDPRCDHRLVSNPRRKCSHRAPLKVAYTLPRIQGAVAKRVLTNRCVQHGYDDSLLPRGARWIVRVERRATVEKSSRRKTLKRRTGT